MRAIEQKRPAALAGASAGEDAYCGHKSNPVCPLVNSANPTPNAPGCHQSDAARPDGLEDGSKRPTANSEPTWAYLYDLHPSPENVKLYNPVDPSDADVVALADSVKEHGILEPLVVTQDGYIISGHRRFVAARLAGEREVPIRVEPICREDDPDGFIRLLREHNRQRIKGLDEQLREAVVEADPDVAYEALIEHRRQKSDMSDFDELTAVDELDERRRKGISAAKEPMLAAALKVIEARRAFWPLSDRQIHYALLNDPPLRHASKRKSRYRNDKASYHDLCDLLTRARLNYRIQWGAIGDETRPVMVHQGFANVQEFVRQELDGLFVGYWRDYQRTQPNHIEIVGEKLTIRSIVEPVARKYGIPMTIGRGYCSITPRHELAQRFKASGKDRLVVLMLSDHDPDGETIAESFARSLRDDFGIEAVDAFKVALTGEQVRELNLPPTMKAKAGSSTRARFVEKHGDDVFELEAVPPEKLQELLRAAVVSVMDLDAYNRELRAEKADAAFLDTVRRRTLLVLPDCTGPDSAEARPGLGTDGAHSDATDGEGGGE